MSAPKAFHAPKWKLLADPSALLESSLDLHTTLEMVVALAVPTVADWAAIAIRSEDGLPSALHGALRSSFTKTIVCERLSGAVMVQSHRWTIPYLIRSGIAEIFLRIQAATWSASILLVATSIEMSYSS